MTADAPDRYGVIGYPVLHSHSPVIHRLFALQTGQDMQYELLQVPPDKLTSAVRQFRRTGGKGLNVTVPHKVNIMRLVDELHPSAQRIGAINTIVVSPDGRLSGMNNDGVGYIQSLRDRDPAWRADRGPVLVLGAGGAARAIVASLLDEGAPEVRLANRTPERAQVLAQALGDPRIQLVNWQDRNEAMAGVQLLVNTTTQGMHGQTELEVRLDALPAQAWVSDAIYIPLETPLLSAARQRGHVTVNGLGMLLNQARPAFHAWFGVMPEITPALLRDVMATF